MVRVEMDSRAIILNGVGPIIFGRKGKTTIVIGAGKIRLRCNRLVVMCDGVIKLFARSEQITEVAIGVGVGRVNSQHFGKLLFGFVGFSLKQINRT